jgi:hypothetical protein
MQNGVHMIGHFERQDRRNSMLRRKVNQSSVAVLQLVIKLLRHLYGREVFVRTGCIRLQAIWTCQVVHAGPLHEL